MNRPSRLESVEGVEPSKVDSDKTLMGVGPHGSDGLAAYIHSGESTMRFGNVTERSLIGWNSKPGYFTARVGLGSDP